MPSSSDAKGVKRSSDSINDRPLKQRRDDVDHGNEHRQGKNDLVQDTPHKLLELVEMCANVQVSDRLMQQNVKYSGRAQSVPPESDLGEKRYFHRKQKIDNKAYEDDRETRSQGDYSHDYIVSSDEENTDGESANLFQRASRTLNRFNRKYRHE